MDRDGHLFDGLDAQRRCARWRRRCPSWATGTESRSEVATKVVPAIARPRGGFHKQPGFVVLGLQLLDALEQLCDVAERFIQVGKVFRRVRAFVSLV